jgi:protein-S-isoprenylcysteine O-methyltransferase Ste14
LVEVQDRFTSCLTFADVQELLVVLLALLCFTGAMRHWYVLILSCSDKLQENEWSPHLQLNEDHKLITSGPYSRIRHPMYTSFLLQGLGLALLTNDKIIAVPLTVFQLIILRRIRLEEEMMIGKFKERYLEYRKRSCYLLWPII